MIEVEVDRFEFEVGRIVDEVARIEVEVGRIEDKVGRIEVEVGSMEVSVRLDRGHSMVDPRSTPIQTHMHTNTNEKSEIKNAVMKCGPEKGHWVVVRQSERE